MRPRFTAANKDCWDARTYKIIISCGKIDKMEKLQHAFKDCLLLVSEDHMQIREDSIVTSWRTIGSPKNQEMFVRMMLKDKDITSLEY